MNYKMYITKKHILAFLLCLVIISLPLVILATDPDPKATLKDVGGKAGYLTEKDGKDIDLLDIVGNVIKILLGLLGVIAVVIIIIGGFKWMTAGGSDDKIGEAKKLIGQGIIGLIIVLAAYGIAYFVMDKLEGEFLTE